MKSTAESAVSFDSGLVYPSAHEWRSRMLRLFFSLFIIVTATSSFATIKPNPLISKFKPIFASFTGSPAALVNGKFGETAWRVSDSSWIACKLTPGPSRILFTWNATNYMWSDVLGQPGTCAEGLAVPVIYQILISDNSSNGSDGTWTVVDSVNDNAVAARSHAITLDGAFWVKMFVIIGKGNIDEIEAFDISDGNDDTWFFVGSGITADAFKKPVQQKTFSFYLSDIVKDYKVTATPAILRGGSNCVTSAGCAIDIAKYLDAAKGIQHIAIELGSTEAAGGEATNVAGFAANIKLIIDACKKRNVEPLFARIPAVNPEVTSWQIHEDFLKTIDAIVKKNKLNPGPDLYTWFLGHPDELSADGIHPTPQGGASIQRLWAEAVYKLYEAPAEKQLSR